MDTENNLTILSFFKAIRGLINVKAYNLFKYETYNIMFNYEKFSSSLIQGKRKSCCTILYLFTFCNFRIHSFESLIKDLKKKSI